MGIWFGSKIFLEQLLNKIDINGVEINQEIFLSFSTTIFINFSIMIGWLRHFQLNDFKIRWWTLLLSLISFIIMFIVGVIREFTDMDDISLKVRIVSFVLLIMIPLYIFSIWIFYGIWRSNKFNLFSQHYRIEYDDVPCENFSNDSTAELYNGRREIKMVKRKTFCP